MSHEPTWVGWGRELQAIAETGLHFSESEYDRERYRKTLKISVEIFANYSGESPALIRGLFENQSGYATPKVDVREVVFRDDKLLLVQERTDGLWTLPGLLGGEAKTSTETTGVEFAGENEIPPLSLSRNTREQIQFCFDARKNPDNPCQFD